MDRFLRLTACWICLVEIVSILGQDSTTIGPTSTPSTAGNMTFRICVPNFAKEACMKMNEHVSDGRIVCVFANDKIGCIEKVGKNEADFLPLQPEEIYIASKFKNAAFNVIGEIRSTEFKNRDFRYEPVAVIRNAANIKSLADLKGKNTCHTGYGRNAGWKVPFSHLLDRGQLSSYCDEIKAPVHERDLYAMSKYFGQGCAPGPWVPEKDVNKRLQQKYANLCQLCENVSDCSGADKYAGYEGALKCLTLKNGDVAWTKMDAVEKVFNLKSVPISITSQFSFLCWDGSSMPLTTPSPCSMAKRPWGALLISSRHNHDFIDELHRHLELYEAVTSEAITLALELNSTTQQLFKYPARLSKTITPLAYLSTGRNYTVTIEKPSCPSVSKVRFCVLNELEKLKCLDLRLGSIGQRILPEIGCVVGRNKDDCYEKIRQGQADVISVGVKEAGIARRSHGLVPLLAELERIDVEDTKPEPYRFALAVVKKDNSRVGNITDLRGSRSCHGSITSLAGWNVPMRVLREKGLLQDGAAGCNLSTFFNGSCVPGGDEPRYVQSWFPKSLCELCVGDSPDPETRSPGTWCKNNRFETYFGDFGALKCLEDNVADVAFIDHVAVLHLLQDHTAESKVNSLRLLCLVGGQMELKDYRHCTWGKIPSNQLITRESSDGNYVDREDARITLLKATNLFSPIGKAPAIMNLFGPYYGNPDLLFKDTSFGLTDYIPDVSIPEDLPEDVDPCRSRSSSISVRLLVVFVSIWISVFKNFAQ